MRDTTKKNPPTPEKTKNRVISVWLTIAAVFLLTTVLGYFCVKTHDDYLTAVKPVDELFTDALYYGNGRYLGNFLVDLCLARKPVDAVVRGTLITGIVVLSAAVAARVEFKTLSLSLLLFVGFGNVVFREAIVWGHGFYNFVPPVFCALLALLTLKTYYLNGRTRFRGGKILLLGVLGVVQQLFSENTTCIALLVAAALFVLTVIKKKPKAVSAAYLIGSATGAGLMFLLPEIMQVSYKMDGYRGRSIGADSVSELIRLLTHNGQVCFMSLVPMFPIWAALSYGMFRALRGYTGTNRFLRKSAPFLRAVFLCQPLFSMFYFFIDDKNSLAKFQHATESIPHFSTAVLLFVFGFFILYLLAVFAVLAADEKLRGCRPVYIGLYILGALSVGEVLIITVMGGRCLFLTGCILSVFVIRFLDREGFSDRKTGIVSAVCGLAYLLAVIGILHSVWQVDNVRAAYAREQIAAGKKEIEIIILPHDRWLWYSDKNYGFYDYYKPLDPESGSLSFKFVPYETYQNGD
ncbi:MAG: hypothetical protein IJL26_08250 [Clostridia bacterium]|nr:hypothetical protein [Clostridia bacterium]